MQLAAANSMADAARARADVQVSQVARTSMEEGLAELDALKASAANASATHGKCC